MPLNDLEGLEPNMACSTTQYAELNEDRTILSAEKM